jgi:hypothetical protein
MNRFEKRKLKTGVYRHVNALMYTCIFTIASIITIAAAVNRTDNIMYIDEEQAISTVKESVAFTDKDVQKVAIGEEETLDDTTTGTPEDITESLTEPDVTTAETATDRSSGGSIKVVADTLNVRIAAGEDAEVLGMIDQDDIYEMISNQGEWIEINYNGNNGFVKSEYVEVIQNAE